MTPLPALSDLLPHGPEARVLSAPLSFSEDGCVMAARVDPEAAHLDGAGALPAWVALEMMAQAASAFSGWRHLQAGRPIRVGYLLGTRRFEARVAAFPVGAVLEVEARVRLLDDAGPSAFDCEVRHAGNWVARATLKAIEPS